MSGESALPTRLQGVCGDCGTTVTLSHPNGLGGSGSEWPCLVCISPMRLLPPEASDQ